MRIWGKADPRFLNRKHLLGEHREVHALLSGKCTHPEWVERFEPRPIGLLALRHELLRFEMDRRWWGRHSPNTHPTPVEFIYLTNPFHKRAYDDYRHRLPSDDTDEYFIRQRDADFHRIMESIDFPPPVAPDGADTPWDRDSMTLQEYIDLGDDWQKDLHHA